MIIQFYSKEQFDILAPEGELNAISLNSELKPLVDQSLCNHRNLILDFSQCETNECIHSEQLSIWKNDFDAQKLSFVICGAKSDLKKLLLDVSQSLNIQYAPTQVEAIDIVSMEIIERELLDDF